MLQKSNHEAHLLDGPHDLICLADWVRPDLTSYAFGKEEISGTNLFRTFQRMDLHDAIFISMRSKGAALAQANGAKPDATRVRPPSDTRRRAAPLFDSEPTIDAGYYVAHEETERSTEGPAGQEHGR